MRFEFATATRIIFGSGTLKEAGPVAKGLGQRALIVTGSNPERAAQLNALLEAAGVGAVLFSMPGEPKIGTIQQGADLAEREQCDLIIGFGGGSAMDAGKAIAAKLRNPGPLSDYLEVVGLGKALPKAPAPFVAIPTTAGTGAEVTRNAVLASPEHRVKVSLRSPLMLPRVALVDPELTIGLPKAMTAASGLDALTQLIEPYVSCRANPMTDTLCREGIRRAARSLRRACEDGCDLAAREDMALASLWSGMALANAGLGAVHGFAGPIGGMFPAPHGAVCAALLPHVMNTNLRALRERAPGGEHLRRFEEVSQLLKGDSQSSADDGVRWVQRLVEDLNIPPLRSYGITAEHKAELVQRASTASSMKGNPLPLAPEELGEILEASL